MAQKCTLHIELNVETLNGVIFHLYFMISLMIWETVNNLKTKAAQRSCRNRRFWIIVDQPKWFANVLSCTRKIETRQSKRRFYWFVRFVMKYFEAICTYLLSESPTNQLNGIEIFQVSKILRWWLNVTCTCSESCESEQHSYWCLLVWSHDDKRLKWVL